MLQKYSVDLLGIIVAILSPVSMPRMCLGLVYGSIEMLVHLIRTSSDRFLASVRRQPDARELRILSVCLCRYNKFSLFEIWYPTLIKGPLGPQGLLGVLFSK